MTDTPNTKNATPSAYEICSALARNAEEQAGLFRALAARLDPQLAILFAAHAATQAAAPEPAELSAPVQPSDPEEAEPSSLDWSAMKSLRTSMMAAKVRLQVPLHVRELGPWSALRSVPESQLTGEHRYLASELNPGAGQRYDVLTIDRNASYPSAMGSVPVPRDPGDLVYIQDPPLSKLGGTSGFYVIDPFGWVGSHPLGQIAEQTQFPNGWLISTPHMRLLLKLHKQHRLSELHLKVREAWCTSKLTNAAFTDFSNEVRHQRSVSADDADRMMLVKRSSSIAIRSLWTSGETRTPFLRPDCSISIRAEAAVRHWVKADAVAASTPDAPILLRLGTVDEADFAIPEDAEPGFVPAGYTLGSGYGAVKIKSRIPLSAWLTVRGGRRRG